MFELKLIGIKKYMEATLVVNNISFEAYEGDRIGIVGANGSGKSTILKLIAGIEQMNYYPGYPQTSSPGYDEGLIKMSRGASCAYLEQIPTYPEGLRVKDVLNLAFEELELIEEQIRELEGKMQTLEGTDLEKTLNRYSDLVQQYELKGGYEKEEKLSKVCTGLKFDESFLNRDFDLLSGGEKTTVVLGKLLIHNPNILLLDEPTNHLHMDSIEWLEGYLNSYKGIVIIVSHDRYFLDNVVMKIVEIEDMESISYKGNYSSYVSQKEENMRIQYEHFREQQKSIKNMEQQVKNLRDWAMRADNNKFFRRAASIQKKLDKMDRIDKPTFERRNMRLNLTATERSGNETIKAVELSKSYGDKIIFKNADVLIKYGERVGLIGQNGSGKTSFIKMLLGEELPDSGSVQLGANVMPAYLPQKIAFNNEESTVLETFRENISILEGKAREYLSKFMFYKSTVFKKVKHLSGGERIRLKLALLLYQDINLLILDEPTNHLDIESIETLEEALDDFEGTIFFVSHDRYFINKIGQRIVAIDNNTFKSYPGNYDEYKSEKDKLNLIDKEKHAIKEKKDKQKSTNLYERSENKERKKEKALTKIEKLEKEISEIDVEMLANQSEYEVLDKLNTRKVELTEELECMLNLWVSLEEY
ncbi:ribosomal protection-like ABC-F family protein [Ureibacillus manganicus]|uniref:ABC transporter ATP-binding protein n=1 Tax=Ureibacillus manganicus DSM 26584 TaxID=1384049 RepID=A0A0A3I6R6_9BACL|nr:ABC-F family ATP-binding cassette domain-containing protein [Ureibacillus manganicus]KGR79215.1 ABC transporter ATP-binding protein [Ureibacillus manganicus DSM 26584]